MNVYFDTSALIKLILEEEGSEIAEELWDGADLAISCRLTYPEARAALAAARRQRRLDAKQLRSAAVDLKRIVEELRVIEIDAGLSETVGELAERYELRAYDAVHLAAALEVTDDRLVMATWDAELRRATVEAGRMAVPAG